MNNRFIQCTGISYKTESDVEEKYTLGSRKPAAIIRSAEKNSGTLMLTIDEFNEIQKAIPRGESLLNLIDVYIVVKTLSRDGTEMVDRIEDVFFTEIPLDYKAEESAYAIELPFKAGNIQYRLV